MSFADDKVLYLGNTEETTVKVSEPKKGPVILPNIKENTHKSIAFLSSNT